MNRRVTWLVLGAVLVGVGTPANAVQQWRLSLPDTLVVSDGLVTLSDLAAGPVPAAAGKVVLRSGLAPNSVVTISRREILRRLVTSGLAGGVSLAGAEECHLVFPGKSMMPDDLEQDVRRVVQDLVPPAVPGAPDSWLELELPRLELGMVEKWQVETDRQQVLVPGRNMVRVRLVEGSREESMTVTVTLHMYGETGTAIRDIPRETPLSDGMFVWNWRDLAEVENGLAVGRSSIQGASPTRDLKADQGLRQADLKETPMIRAGDQVDLQVVRGQVAVVVKAHARQNGCLGQTIPVRNELNGRLVNARVAGPGLVEWRR